MSDILQRILATKHKEVAEAKRKLPLAEMEARAAAIRGEPLPATESRAASWSHA